MSTEEPHEKEGSTELEVKKTESNTGKVQSHFWWSETIYPEHQSPVKKKKTGYIIMTGEL